MVLNIITIAAKVSEMLNSFENEIFGNDDGQSITFESGILTIMFLISCVNVWSMRQKYKTYILFHQPTSGINDLDKSFKVNSPNASIVLTDVQNDMDRKVQKGSWISNETWEKEVVLGERWQIKVWDPAEIHLTLFSSFSPMHVLMLFNMNQDNFWSTLIMLIINYYIMGLINDLWAGRLRDQTIVSGQVLNEFTNGFVYKLSAFKRKNESSSQSF